ncbi:hypothetical protein GCM10007884_38540 [Methylobacterium brachythecii]|uniref:Uncharacterized protein n=1 Tax=Methylobacterium brachythecii TaxID=1176177 RepID=A0ABQ6DC16_9HYPH|nr:hypothetical protein GCM10007884_38540 [Methylobacterium brachythecii]
MGPALVPHGDGAMGMGPWGWGHGDGAMGMGPWGWGHGDGAMGMVMRPNAIGGVEPDLRR